MLLWGSKLPSSSHLAFELLNFINMHTQIKSDRRNRARSMWHGFDGQILFEGHINEF